MLRKRIVLSGVGGQGIVLLTRVIGEVLTKRNINVISSETHGMATRGGSISSFMNIGDFYSPVLGYQKADIGVCLDSSQLEFVRFYVKPKGIIITTPKLKEANMFALGIIAKLLNLDLEEIKEVLKKLGKLTDKNIKAIEEGFKEGDRYVSTKD